MATKRKRTHESNGHDGIQHELGRLRGGLEAVANERATFAAEARERWNAIGGTLERGFENMQVALDRHATDDRQQFSAISQRFARQDGAEAARWARLRRWGKLGGLLAAAATTMSLLWGVVAPWFGR